MTQVQGTTLPAGVTNTSPPLIVPEKVRARVSVSPVPVWVVDREVDETYRAPGGGPHSILLIDRQRRGSDNAHFERVVRRLETLQAVQEGSQWRLDFDPATQYVELHTLSVRREGQITEHARPERIRLLQREENLERYILDGWVSAIVLLEDVRMGDIIEVSFTIRTEPRLFRDRHWHFAFVPWTVPLRAFHLRILFPSTVTMQWKSDLPGAAPTERQIGGEREWTWSVENTSAVESEPEVPTWYLPGRWFQVSDFASWGNVSAGLLEAWREDFSDRELARMAEQIASEAATPADRADRAMALVQDEIRYLSCNEEFGGQTPSPPGAVLQRRFGDCKDKAFLLVHLLRRLGIPARPVLVHSHWRKMIAKILPTPDAFNHAIVEYEIDGHRRWCDTTAPLQGGGALGRSVASFGLGLPIGPDVTGLEFVTSPDKVRHKLDLEETFYLDSAGRSSTMTMLVTASGAEADNLRCSLALEGAEAIGRSREKFYQGFFPDLKRSGELQFRDDRRRNEVVIAASYDVQNPFANDTGEERLFHFQAHLIQSVLALPSNGIRRQPLALRYPCNFRHTIDIHSPGIKASLHDRKRPPGMEFFFEVDVRSGPGRISYDYTIRTTKDAVAPGHFTDHSKVVRDLWPHTQVEIAIPTGIALPRRRHVDDALLPTTSAGTRRRPVERSVAAEALQGAALASTPAPALRSASKIEAESAEKPAVAELEEELAAPSRAEVKPDRPRATPPQPAAESVPRRRRRSHRHRDSSAPDRTWLFLILVVGLSFVAMVVALSMNKK